jgi:2-(1,2-epoxy-1,2-dihydrophenyl)acetyl-CoA isomerase
LLGQRRALDLLLTNRRLTAQEMVEWGLASRSVSPEQLDVEARALAAALASGPTHALRSAKQLVRESAQHTFAESLDAERRSIVEAIVSAEGVEGTEAFLSKRPPRFSWIRRAGGAPVSIAEVRPSKLAEGLEGGAVSESE